MELGESGTEIVGNKATNVGHDSVADREDCSARLCICEADERRERRVDNAITAAILSSSDGRCHHNQHFYNFN